MTNVTVTSVVKLSPQQTTKIKDSVTRKYGSDVVYTFETDASILGGLIININSRKLDASVKTKLEDIKQELYQKIMSE